MKLMPSAEVISFSCPATSSCSCSLSMTQGPAIRKNGWSRPTSNPQRFIGKPFLPRIYADKSRSGVGALEQRYKSECHGPRDAASHHLERIRVIRVNPWQGSSRTRLLQQLAPGLALARGADEADEERVARARGREEFRVRLAGD